MEEENEVRDLEYEKEMKNHRLLAKIKVVVDKCFNEVSLGKMRSDVAIMMIKDVAAPIFVKF